MYPKLFGIPQALIGSVCLVFAVVWFVVWPQDKAAGAVGLRFLTLRYGHALVWLLLAIAAFSSLVQPLHNLARPIALMALGVYLAFMFALATG